MYKEGVGGYGTPPGDGIKVKGAEEGHILLLVTKSW